MIRRFASWVEPALETRLVHALLTTAIVCVFGPPALAVAFWRRL